MSKETLKANLREIPDFPIPGILFYDVTTLFKNAGACRKCWTLYMKCIRTKVSPK